MTGAINVLESHRFVVHRLRGARDGALERIRHIHTPIADHISAVREDCRTAIDEASVDGGEANRADILEHAQRQIGRAIALEQYFHHPEILRVLLKQYRRAVELCEEAPRFVTLKDVEPVYDPAEYSEVIRGYEFLAPGSPLGEAHDNPDEISAREQLLENAVKSGRKDAKLTLGLDRDDAELLREAAREGSLDAQYEFAATEGGTENARFDLLGAARQGHAMAQARLGTQLFENAESEQESFESIGWLRKAAEQGHSGAQTALGKAYESGDGVAQNNATAREYYEHAAALGDPDGEYRLALLLYRIDPAHKAETLVWLLRAAGQEHGAASLRLGRMYLEGSHVPKDLGAARAAFARVERSTDGDALFELGSMYACGNGVGADLTRARACYESAAKLDHVHAQFEYAQMCERGLGGVVDSAQAKKYYQSVMYDEPSTVQPQAYFNFGHMCLRDTLIENHKLSAFGDFACAAGSGYAPAQTQMANMLQAGIGCRRDEARAIEWFKNAAAQDDHEAHYKLALAYLKGQGVPRDAGRAIPHLQTAAQRYADAQYRLGQHYLDGSGVEKDVAAAYEWFGKAADQGNRAAQFKVGMSYFYGLHHDRDLAKAIPYLESAAEGGFAQAQSCFGQILAANSNNARNDARAIAFFRSAADQREPFAKIIFGLALRRGFLCENNLPRSENLLSATTPEECRLLDQARPKAEAMFDVWVRRVAAREADVSTAGPSTRVESL